VAPDPPARQWRDALSSCDLGRIGALDQCVRALTMAAGHDRVAVIEALLEAGTPVNAVDAWGSTALQAATENGRTASVAALAAAGAIS
jgi:ankyrin repeat protein